MNTKNPIRLLLVDDHPVVRDGLMRIQELAPHIQIVGEAASLKLALETALRLAPDFILMDVRLPDGDGIEGCRQIKAALPKTRVLILTSFGDNHLVLASMEAGADGYLLKESDTHRIVNAIDSILEGRTFFDPIPVSRRRSDQGRVNPLDTLPARERRVLAEVAKGKTDKEVAATLGLTTKTARNYLDRTFAKLGVHTRTEAALLYARFGESTPTEDYD